LDVSLGKIGSRPLEKLRAHFRSELFEQIIPLWESGGIDHEFGGYLPYRNKDGTYASFEKRLYHQGRVLWLFSYFYNHFGRKTIHLEAARQGKEALTRNALAANGRWYARLSRDWKPAEGEYDIFADIYMILGLGEYFRASGDEEAWRLAVDTTYAVSRTILSPHYQGRGVGARFEPGIRQLGVWLHFLSALTPLLKYREEPGVERIARICMRFILGHHWQKERGFAFEFLDRDGMPFADDYLSLQNQPGDDYFSDGKRLLLRFVSSWHCLQAAWMAMEEAVRIGDRRSFMDGRALGYGILDKAWEGGRDGGFLEFETPEGWKKTRGSGGKPTGSLSEGLVFTLLVFKHTGSSVAAEWFDKIFKCAYGKPDRWDRMDTLHQPRGVMFGLQILDRIIERRGKISQFLGVSK